MWPPKIEVKPVSAEIDSLHFVTISLIPIIIFLTKLILAVQGADGEPHERASAAKQQAVDRRIEIQPAEDEDGSKYISAPIKIRYKCEFV